MSNVSAAALAGVLSVLPSPSQGAQRRDSGGIEIPSAASMWDLIERCEFGRVDPRITPAQFESHSGNVRFYPRVVGKSDSSRFDVHVEHANADELLAYISQDPIVLDAGSIVALHAKAEIEDEDLVLRAGVDEVRGRFLELVPVDSLPSDQRLLMRDKP